MTTKQTIRIFKNRSELRFLIEDKYVAGNLIYECKGNEINLLAFFIASVTALHTLKLPYFKMMKITNNEVNVTFISPEILKLKTLRKKWKGIILNSIPKPLTLSVENLIFPFLHFNFPVQKLVLTADLFVLLSLPKVELSNLSTFEEGTQLFHRLTLKIPNEAIRGLSNDHRVLNKTLQFFYFDEKNGSGFPFWLPNGLLVKNLIRDFVYNLEIRAGFTYVQSPLLGTKKMYQTSDHLKHYETYMFPALNHKNEILYLRPMTCPHHCLLFTSEPRSYANLPLRFSENAVLFRQEASGALLGMERVRQMELKDSHIFLPVNEEMIKKELWKCLNLTQQVLAALQIKIHTVYLSVNDHSGKFINLPQLWKTTTNLLETVCKENALKYVLKKGEAAFYGPKIDFQIKTALHHNITISTVQLDFALGEKFALKYRTNNPTKREFKTPILIHHGLIGTYERLLVILMEQNNGWLPFWLAPVQVILIPLNATAPILNYTMKIASLMRRYQLRIEIANSKQTLAENVRSSWVRKIPFRVFIGETERKQRELTYQQANGQRDKKTLAPLPFIDWCLKMNERKE